MTKEQILKKAIEKAEKNGYTGFAKMLPIPVFPSKDEVTRKERAERIVGVMMKAKQNDIIFSHDFAKAFWGEKKIVKCPICGRNPNEPCEAIENLFGKEVVKDAKIGQHDYLLTETAWIFHIQEMVKSKDPIKYLEKFL